MRPVTLRKNISRDRGVPIEVVIVDELLKQGIARSLEVKELQTPITMCYAGEATQLVIGYSSGSF